MRSSSRTSKVTKGKSMVMAVVAVATVGAVSLPASAPAQAAATIRPVEVTSAVATVKTPAVKRRNRVRANVKTGPSKWRGKRLRHPNGRRFPRRVLRWANLVRSVMREHRIRGRYLRGILAQIQQESSGRPRAVNRWDSNARRGTPSKGLLQVILPTYRAYAKRGLRRARYQTVPYSNIWASLNYVKRRYGMRKFRSWNRGRNQGY